MTRARKGFIIGLVGTVCNALLAAVKLAVGFISGSIAVQTDAVNNIGDVLSTAALAFSFLYSGKKADKEHPLGHGRLEYVVSLIMVIVIIVIAIEFIKTAIKRIITPLPVLFSWHFFAVIAAGVVVKLGMGIFYRLTNRNLSSKAIRASEIDSFQDVLISAATLISFAVSRFTDMPIDAIFALGIGFLILITGVKLIKGIVTSIIGGSDTLLRSKLMSFIMEQPDILGAHDLILHDYGPDRSIASVHAEMPSSLSLNDAHRVIDDVEKKAAAELGVDLVVHIDPVDIDDKKSRDYKNALARKLREIHPSLCFHDLRVDAVLKTVSADIVIPFGLSLDENMLAEELDKLDFGGFRADWKIDYQ